MEAEVKVAAKMAATEKPVVNPVAKDRVAARTAAVVAKKAARTAAVNRAATVARIAAEVKAATMQAARAAEMGCWGAFSEVRVLPPALTDPVLRADERRLETVATPAAPHIPGKAVAAGTTMAPQQEMGTEPPMVAAADALAAMETVDLMLTAD